MLEARNVLAQYMQSLFCSCVNFSAFAANFAALAHGPSTWYHSRVIECARCVLELVMDWFGFRHHATGDGGLGGGGGGKTPMQTCCWLQLFAWT